jgi:hypothetical protein
MSTSLSLLGGGEAFASVARATRRAEAATAATKTIVMRRVTLRPKGLTGSSVKFWDTGITPFCQKQKKNPSLDLALHRQVVVEGVRGPGGTRDAASPSHEPSQACPWRRRCWRRRVDT